MILILCRRMSGLDGRRLRGGGEPAERFLVTSPRKFRMERDGFASQFAYERGRESHAFMTRRVANVAGRHGEQDERHHVCERHGKTHLRIRFDAQQQHGLRTVGVRRRNAGGSYVIDVRPKVGNVVRRAERKFVLRRMERIEHARNLGGIAVDFLNKRMNDNRLLEKLLQ